MNNGTKNHQKMIFQVIQDQMVLDNSTIESATIVPLNGMPNEYGVKLKLKAIAADKLGSITDKNIRKQTNIILNGASNDSK